MGIFNYKGLSDAQSQELFSDALAMTMYSYHNLDDGLAYGYQHYGFGLGLPLTLLTALVGNSQSQGIVPGLPWNPNSEQQALDTLNTAGWQVISAEQLGYQGKTDKLGTYYGESWKYKTSQAEVLGKYDSEGKLIGLGVAFRGTTGPRETLITDTIGDAIHDLVAGLGPASFSNNFALNAFGRLLGDVAKFAAAHGLSGEDVTITGHSLGGLATNSLAFLSEDYWDGFYANSKYLAFASPTQHEGDGKVLNIGYENDPVFRVLDGTHFNWSTLGVHDKPHESATNNIVNFNDYYASKFWGLLPTSILNLPSWISHVPFTYGEGLSRIVNSEFYSFMDRDSTVVVSTLSDVMRGKTWVEDLNLYAQKHTGTTFIIGTDKDDLIGGGRGNDYLEGGAGNDIFRDDGGFNYISGGEGHDTLILQQGIAKTQVAYDGENLYLRDSTGAITIANSVETLRSQSKGAFGSKQYVDYQVKDDGLLVGNIHVDYTRYGIGSEADDVLQAAGNQRWLFGLDGDDALLGSSNGNLTFVGGRGNDVMHSAGQNNTFLFEGEFGQDQVINFGQSDRLVFFTPQDQGGDFRQYATQHNDDVVFTFGDNQVTLVGVSLDYLSNSQIVLV